jgi:predicted nucleic acid-binding protein
MVSVARRSLLAGKTSLERAAELMTAYFGLPIEVVSHRALLPRALQLWRNFSPYDAVYLALAEELTGTLVTADRRFAAAAATHSNVTVADVSRDG